MTRQRFLDLFERLAGLTTSRGVQLFIKNELDPLEETNPQDNRLRDLYHAAAERLNYARAAGR